MRNDMNAAILLRDTSHRTSREVALRRELALRLLGMVVATSWPPRVAIESVGHGGPADGWFNC